MMTWRALRPGLTAAHLEEMLGYIPQFLDDRDPRPAREQLDANYQHGGGWWPMTGFKMLPSGNLSYPGDPPVGAIAETMLREECVRFYEHSWVAIIQRDGSWEVARMD